MSYAEVITKMTSFDESLNGTLRHYWTSREGDAETVVNYPASTFGIDANRTFEYASLVVFTDAYVVRRPDACNITLGFLACMSGSCYRSDRRCDGQYDCEDRSDESGCPSNTRQQLVQYRLKRINRFLSMYTRIPGCGRTLISVHTVIPSLAFRSLKFLPICFGLFRQS